MASDSAPTETREARLRKADEELAAFGHDPVVMRGFSQLSPRARIAWAHQMFRLYQRGERARAGRP